MIQRQKLLRSVENKFGRGKYHEWKNKDYEDLSFVIHRQTKVLISVATLKRLFKKVKTNDNYSPQESTLQALIAYSDFKPKARFKKKKIVLIFSVVGLLFLTALLTWILILRSNGFEQIQKLSGSIILQKQEGTCPSTAFFNIEIPKTKEPIYINYGDRSLKYLLSDNEEVNTHFYAYPGYFNAKLETKTRVISDTASVLVPTNGWRAFTHYFVPDEVEEEEIRYYPLPLASNITNGYFRATPKNLASIGIDTTQIVVVRLDNFKKTNIQGDSFVYNTHFNNSGFWPGIRCFSVVVRVVGTKGVIHFKFVGEGCSSYSEYIISEKYITGLNDDLSQFVLNTNDWVKLSISNTNKQIEVKVNNEFIFSDTYNNSIGNIIGTSMIFHGSGLVDYIQLILDEEGSVFNEDFN